MSQHPTRCDWATQYEIYLPYHDQEWGLAVFDNQKLFEMLVLESMQAGLSWKLILEKRKAFQDRFDDFNPEKIANYDKIKIEKLLSDSSIIRNKAKILATIHNAKLYLELLNKNESLSALVWKMVDGKPLVNHWQTQAEVPASTELSDKMTKELKSKGFKFLGTTICYSFMQAVGIVNDHLLKCYRHSECTGSHFPVV